MLPPGYRLRSDRDFQRVFQRKQSTGSREFVLYWAANRLEHSRLGIVLSKKYGKAAKRNRMKRLVRETLRHNLDQINPGFDIVLVVRGKAEPKTLWDVEPTIIYILHKAGLMKAGHEQRGKARLVLPIAKQSRA